MSFAAAFLKADTGLVCNILELWAAPSRTQLLSILTLWMEIPSLEADVWPKGKVHRLPLEEA